MFFPMGRASASGLRDFSSPRQRRDFVAGEWEFFSSFFKLNDFCGILLFPDLLPRETVDGFHRRFGKAQAEAELSPGPGPVEFIPKPREWRKLVDPVAGRSLKLRRPVFSLPLGRRLFFSDYALDDLLGDGWARPGPETRNSCGKRADIVFGDAGTGDLKLLMSMSSFGRQRVIFRLNGEKFRTIELDGGEMREISILLPSSLLGKTNILNLDLPDSRERRKRNGTVVEGIRIAWMQADPA